MSSQKPSTLKSKSTSDKMDNRHVKAGKKRKEGSEFESENQVEMEDKCFIDQLPPEMLIEVLKHLNVKSLLASRLVSRKCNGIARQILESRKDVQAVFYCYRPQHGSKDLRISVINNRRKLLSGFANCFKASRGTPLYTRFRFIYFEAAVFDHPNWTNFISVFGNNIKCLKLELDKCRGSENLKQLAEKLGGLLLNQLPNLQEFGLQFPFNPWQIGHDTSVKLFSKSVGNSNSGATAPRLNIRTIHLQHSSCYPEIVSDLLNASPNLEKLEHFRGFGGDQGFFQDFLFFHELGKLPCIQTAFICLYHNFFSQDQDQDEDEPNSSTPLAFKLKQLKLRTHSAYYNKNIWSDSSSFLSNLFESSKDTLTELDMEPFGFLDTLQLAKFNKLTKLTIFSENCSSQAEVQGIQVLPPGINLMETFPVLQHLELDVPWTNFSPPENIACIPNLRTVKIKDPEMRKQDIIQISQECPNLKDFGIRHSGLKDFPQVGEGIWTHLTKLVALHLEIDMKNPNPPTSSFPALDSCFTGFSGEDSIRLYELAQAEKSFENPEMAPERQSASILNLKNLRNLTVIVMCKSWNNGNRDSEVPKKMLAVSERYAFQTMNDLSYTIKMG